jgi:hypothetical protein
LAESSLLSAPQGEELTKRNTLKFSSVKHQNPHPSVSKELKIHVSHQGNLSDFCGQQLTGSS